MKWVASQKNIWVRMPLSVIVFPVYFLPLVVSGVFSGRVYEFEFWDFHWGLFWAIAEGAFTGN